MTAETELVQSFGGSWSHEDALGVVGAGLWESAAILQRAGVDREADAIVERLPERGREPLQLHGVPWQPGARELLQELRDAGVRTALVTMSIRSMAEDIVSAIPFHAFDELVTGDQVAEPKPHPEPYLTAAKRLGVDIAD
jgi:beta-phosphoglucomutase-like phosphatase (HAD superfamily)